MSTDVSLNRRSKPGRPLLGDERMTTIALRMEAKEVRRLDVAAHEAGESRSQIIRRAVRLFFDPNSNHTDNIEVA